MLMITAVLIVLGLCLGSFVNALVWRLHEQSKSPSKQSKKIAKRDLSIVSGRSICTDCGHILAWQDLIPLVSWVSLGGKCRYCRKPISWQYPAVELATALLFVGSYHYWPHGFDAQGNSLFIFWLIFLVGFMAMTVYDLRWYLLPDKLVYPLLYLATAQVLMLAVIFDGGLAAIEEALLGLMFAGGTFYLLYQVSKGKWIGGGDVKLGFVLGLIVGGPMAALLMLFIASCMGTLVAIPLLLAGKAKRSTRLPFGPFLIGATIVVYLFGASIITWYKRQIGV